MWPYALLFLERPQQFLPKDFPFFKFMGLWRETDWETQTVPNFSEFAAFFRLVDVSMGKVGLVRASWNMKIVNYCNRCGEVWWSWVRLRAHRISQKNDSSEDYKRVFEWANLRSEDRSIQVRSRVKPVELLFISVSFRYQLGRKIFR